MTARLLRSAPYFPVADVAKSAASYERVLGFRSSGFAGGEPPQFAICTRDELSVMLRRVAHPERIAPSEKQGGTWDAFFWVDDARSLHAELTGRGAAVVYGPIVQPYEILEFAVRDEDGHVLGFGQAIDSGSGSGSRS
jgi:hypothetical protein